MKIDNDKQKLTDSNHDKRRHQIQQTQRRDPADDMEHKVGPGKAEKYTEGAA